MKTLDLIDSFSEFKEFKNIDRETLMHILEEVFRAALSKRYGTEDNFDIIVNIDKGDLEIFRNRMIVADGEVEDPVREIALSDALKIEDDFEVGEDIAEPIPMSAFVLDYDHNAPNVEHLAKTHFPFYEIIRAKNPDVPYVMISRPDVATNPDSAIERRDVVIDSFRKARAAGDKNVYYIDGETFFLGEFENECTMDGVHPNDLGFTLMANSIGRVLTHILRKF